MSNLIKAGNIVIGRGSPLVLISGPCVIENYETTREIAGILREVTFKLEMPFIFKASYDKANRTSAAAFRGPGLNDGLGVLKKIKAFFQSGRIVHQLFYPLIILFLIVLIHWSSLLTNLTSSISLFLIPLPFY